MKIEKLKGLIICDIIFAVLIGISMLTSWQSSIPYGPLIVLFLFIALGISILATVLLIAGVTVPDMTPAVSDIVRRATTANAFIVNLMLIGLIAFAFWLSAARPELFPPEVYIGLYLVLGVSILLTLLLIMSQAFGHLNLLRADQPLGLPEGSIRALIALILILMFLLIGIYLFRSLSPTAGVLNGLTKDQVLALGAQVASFTAVTPAPVTPVPGATVTPIPDTAITYNVTLVGAIGKDATSMAQQLLTTIGTLVVAVAGFYFGTRAVEVAHGVVSKQPIITKVTPSSNDGETGEFELNIQGRNLLTAESVKLSNGPDEIELQNPKSSDSEITGTVNVDDKASGKWHLTVVNRDGGTGTLKEAFTIGKTPPAPSTTPTISTFDPGGNEGKMGDVEFTITGTNFQTPTVKLVKDTNNISVTVGTTTAEAIECTVNVTKENVGEWDLTVTNQGGGETTASKKFMISAAAS